MLKNHKKSAVKQYEEASILFNFCEFVYNILSMIVEENISSFLTLPRPHDILDFRKFQYLKSLFYS